MNGMYVALDPASANRTEPIARLHVFMQFPCKGVGVSYTCTSIAKGIDTSALGVTIFTPYVRAGVAGSARVVETLPLLLRYLPYRFFLRIGARLTEQSLYRETKEAADKRVILQIWPDLPPKILRDLRELGVPIVREMINCHRGTAKAILDAEYRRLGLTPSHSISDPSIEAECEALDLCDYVFCSNALAEQSVIDNGVPAGKVRSASFGWDPARFRGDGRTLAPIDGVTFIFVGYICVRKGVHLLLRYWARSGIRGRLVLVGGIEPAIAKICAEYLNRDDVTVLDHDRNVGPLYRSADVFVFPSLEEGGPQVTYEAAGCGLPLITSPMGAARMTDASTGFVVDPFDEAGWIEAMQKLATDPDLRDRMGLAARQRAQDFTWSKVAQARQVEFLRIANDKHGEIAPQPFEGPTNGPTTKIACA